MFWINVFCCRASVSKGSPLWKTPPLCDPLPAGDPPWQGLSLTIWTFACAPLKSKQIQTIHCFLLVFLIFLRSRDPPGPFSLHFLIKNNKEISSRELRILQVHFPYIFLLRTRRKSSLLLPLLLLGSRCVKSMKPETLKILASRRRPFSTKNGVGF